MLDTRMKDQIVLKFGQTTSKQDMVKSIYVNDDESILFTGSTDGSMRLWDIRQQAIVKVVGDDKKRSKLNRSLGKSANTIDDFHRDSVWSITPTSDYKLFTGGRDGRICEVDILSSRSRKIVEDDKPITCVAHDAANNYMWYGTSDSTISCVKVKDAAEAAMSVFNDDTN